MRATPREQALPIVPIALAIAAKEAHTRVMPTTLNQALPYLVAAVVLTYAVVHIFF